MSEYLKREDVRKIVLQYGDNAAIAAIDELEPVEIVRCKDCRYCKKEDDYEFWCHGFCNPARLVAPNDYCSRGRRMEVQE